MNKTYAGFGLALLVQVILLAAIPWGRVGDASTGQTIWLEVRASDRQDVMQGPYLDLDYEISDPKQFAEVAKLNIGRKVYAVVHQTDSGVWRGLRVENDLPTLLPENHVAILGAVVDRGVEIHAFLHEEEDGSWTADSVMTGRKSLKDRPVHRQEDRVVASAWVGQGGIVYRDIESYFVPESRRQQLAQDLRTYPEEVFAQVRVDELGRATLLQVRIQERVYDF